MVQESADAALVLERKERRGRMHRIELGVSMTLSAARREVGETLCSWGLERLADDAVAIVGELGGNAVTASKHVIEGIVITVVQEADLVHVEVADNNPDLPMFRSEMPSEEATSGRGFPIISSLSNKWGVVFEPGGKRIWANILVGVAREAA